MSLDNGMIDDLNEPQRQAVRQFAGPMLILAGAGTGKTRVITHRIAWMLKKGVCGSSIVALTFTNKAAREMKSRLHSIAEGASDEVWAGTFHSFCLRALRRFYAEAGLTARFSLLGTSDQLDLIKSALDELGWLGIYLPEIMHSQISLAKNHLLTPAEVTDGTALTAMPYRIDNHNALARVYELYERRLTLNQGIDFDDCILKLIQLLRGNKAVAEHFRDQYRYILVDEYQDTNFAQLSLLQHLAGSMHNVCAVGDDDQSIYSWRGAMYDVLERFVRLFPAARTIKLEQNYRSTNIILDAANKLIAHNPKRNEKKLWSDKKGSQPISMREYIDEKHEADAVATRCLSLIGSGVSRRSIAVLYRTNALARPIELAFRECRLAYQTFGGQSFFERKEVKDFLAYVRFVFNPTDRLALWRVINYPSRGIGLKTLECIDQLAASQGRHPYEILKDVSTSAPNGFVGNVSGIAKFVALIESLMQASARSPAELFSLGRRIITESGMVDDIKRRTRNPSTRERQLDHLNAMPELIKTVAEDQISHYHHFDPKDFLDALNLDKAPTSKTKDDDFVSLMSIHAAKGLEFPYVFITGLEDDQLPHKNSLTDPQALFEERRLFYVALTRAKDKLFLSYSQKRGSGTNQREKVASRFLQELPAKHLEKGDSVPNKPPSKQQILGKLKNLRENIRLY